VIRECAVTHDYAYTADFGSVLARVRDKVVSRIAVASSWVATLAIGVAVLTK